MSVKINLSNGYVPPDSSCSIHPDNSPDKAKAPDSSHFHRDHHLYALHALDEDTLPQFKTLWGTAYSKFKYLDHLSLNQFASRLAHLIWTRFYSLLTTTPEKVYLPCSCSSAFKNSGGLAGSNSQSIFARSL